MEITIKNLFDWVMKGLIFIIIISILFTIGTFAYTKYIVMPTYQSQVKFCVDSVSSYEATLIEYIKQVTPQYIELLKVRGFYQMVADKILEDTGDVYTAGQIGNLIGFSSPVSNTGIFYVTAHAPDPQHCHIIAKAVAETAPLWIVQMKPRDQLLVAEQPVMPRSPSSPNVRRNTLSGLAAGLIISIALVIAKEVLDNRIKTSAEITEMYDLPVLGVVPNFYGSEKKGGD